MPASELHADGIASILALHGGLDVTTLDVSTESGWTDFFVIATATSSTHLRGLYRHVEDKAAELDLTRFNKPVIADDEEWVLLDLGDIIVHLMTIRAREFYELEKLWFRASAKKVVQPSPVKNSGES